MQPNFNERINYSSQNKGGMEKYYIACANECRENNDNKGYEKYMELIKCLKKNTK